VAGWRRRGAGGGRCGPARPPGPRRAAPGGRAGRRRQRPRARARHPGAEPGRRAHGGARGRAAKGGTAVADAPHRATVLVLCSPWYCVCVGPECGQVCTGPEVCLLRGVPACTPSWLSPCTGVLGLAVQGHAPNLPAVSRPFAATLTDSARIPGITHPPHPCAPVWPGQGLAFAEPKLAAGTRAVLPRLRVLCVDECGNPTATLPAGVTGLEARSRVREVGLVFCGVSGACHVCYLASESNARGSRSKGGCMRAPLESQPLAFGTSPTSAACGAPGTQRAWRAAEGCWQQRRACLRRLFIH